MAITIQDVLGFIVTANKEDCEKIVQALRFAQRCNSSSARLSFRPGDFVQFKDKYGVVVKGVVKKVNRKNIDVTAIGTGMKWRVSPTLLERRTESPASQ